MDIDYTDEFTAVTAHFSGFSSQSCGGLVRYEWAVGVEEEGEGRESVMPFTNTGIVIGTNGTGYAQVWCVRVCRCMCEGVQVHVWWCVSVCRCMCVCIRYG